MHQYPAGHVFYRNLTRSFPEIVSGEGCWLTDAEGKRYLDAVGGAFVASLGHGNAEIADAMAAQARRVAYVSGVTFTTEVAEQLATELAATLPGDLDHLFFLSSGSEAVEAALKLARQYWVERGRAGKHRIVALAPAYHGNTLLALSASAREHYKRMFGDWLVDVIRVPAAGYRCACGGTEPLCAACDGSALEAAILEAGAETVAAFIAEPVGGSSTGGNVPPPGWLAAVRRVCDRHEVLFVADEVLCGAGRTGTWWATEPSGVTPDLMTIGKGIAAGYAPLSGIAAPRRIGDVLAAGSGYPLHAQTFAFHPVACATGLAVARYLKAHRLVERCAEQGKVFQEKVAGLRRLPHVAAVRGRGLLAGVEFADDVRTGAPLPRGLKFAETFTAQALAAGLVVWPNVGQADGTNGDLVMLAPPFIVSTQEIDEIVARFATALEQTLSRLAVPVS